MIAHVDINLTDGKTRVVIGIGAARLQELLMGINQSASSDDGTVIVKLCECDDQEPSPVILRVLEHNVKQDGDEPCGC